MAVYGHTRKMEEAFAHIQQGITLSGGDVRMRCALISLKAATGRKEEARNELQELLDLAEQTYISPFHLALAYLGFGDFNKVFDMLEKAFQERSPLLRFLKVIASFDVLRPDPRFQDLLHRVWLTPQTSAF